MAIVPTSGWGGLESGPHGHNSAVASSLPGIAVERRRSVAYVTTPAPSTPTSSSLVGATTAASTSGTDGGAGSLTGAALGVGRSISGGLAAASAAVSASLVSLHYL